MDEKTDFEAIAHRCQCPTCRDGDERYERPAGSGFHEHIYTDRCGVIRTIDCMCDPDVTARIVAALKEAAKVKGEPACWGIEATRGDGQWCGALTRWDDHEEARAFAETLAKRLVVRLVPIYETRGEPEEVTRG